MPKDLYRYFRVEARELVEQLGKGILDLERGTNDPQVVSRLLRLAHTLKGAARVVKQREIADLAHSIEDVITLLRDAAGNVSANTTRQHVDAVLALLDKIGVLIAELTPADDAPQAKPHAPEPPPPKDVLRTMRADSAELSGLLDGVAQAHAQIGALRRSLTATTRACGLADVLVEQLAPRHGRSIQRASGPSHAMAGELRSTLGGLERGLAASVEQMDRELRQVRDAVEQLRLVPAASLFTPIERTVRDAAHAVGRQVVFEGRGGDVRLDAELLGAVQGALLQMARNAVAHGIESEGERIAQGKPVQGRVILDVVRRGQHVVFRCCDDGAGVDVEAVCRAAQRKGLTVPAGKELDASALLQLLMQSGLSTASVVTEVSGRGVGLDVVRDVVERVGGKLAVHTAKGEGTTLELRVPLSIASLEGLVVEAGGCTASMPLDAVRRSLRHSVHETARTAQGDAMVHDGQVIPYVALSRLLQGGKQGAKGPPRPGRFESVVIIEGDAGLAAIGVDRLLGTASMVLRALPELAPAAGIVAGVSLDVEGNPQIVLDPDKLVFEAQRAGTLPLAPDPPRAPVLVIDDSLTTRMLETSILESAGYMVHAAVSAEEGLEQARRQRYSLYLVDVEMPGMDGFTFIEQTRADPTLREVPAILVTSRCSPEDLRRGEQVGASGYIVKSEFAQAEFLRKVRQLVQVP